MWSDCVFGKYGHNTHKKTFLNMLNTSIFYTGIVNLRKIITGIRNSGILTFCIFEMISTLILG